MALGAQLYLTTKHDDEARQMAEKWLLHLDRQTQPLDLMSICPKQVDKVLGEMADGDFGGDLAAVAKPLQRIVESAKDIVTKAVLIILKQIEWQSFCNPQSGCGCLMRPSDIATLYQTEQELGIGSLPDGSVLRPYEASGGWIG